MAVPPRPLLDGVERPAVVTVAVVLVAAAAVLNAAIGVFFLVTALRGAVQGPRGASVALPGGAVAVLVVIALMAFAFAAAVLVLALLTRAGRRWARTALFGTSMLAFFALVQVTVPGVLVLVLLLVADVLLHRSSVTRWLRRTAGLAPG